jgi:hypothetical protein
MAVAGLTRLVGCGPSKNKETLDLSHRLAAAHADSVGVDGIDGHTGSMVFRLISCVLHERNKMENARYWVLIWD